MTSNGDYIKMEKNLKAFKKESSKFLIFNKLWVSYFLHKNYDQKIFKGKIVTLEETLLMLYRMLKLKVIYDPYFLGFSGQKSNYQFDSLLFVWPFNS